MRSYKNCKIIGVDAGYGNIKSASTIFPTGLTVLASEPVFDGSILEMDNVWYRIGEGHKAYNPDKTADEEFYVLTMASVASELKQYGLTEANVILALGLPTTWTGRQKEDYRRYMLRNPVVSFTFNKVGYRLHFEDCFVFPQGYAGIVPVMDNDKRLNGFANFAGTVMLADIGNGTMNIMQLQDGRPDEKHCWTEVLGVNQCVLSARKQMMDRFGIDLQDSAIESYLRTGRTTLRPEYLAVLQNIIKGYVSGLFDSLRAHGYDARTMRLYIMGGGGCLVKNFGRYDKESVFFIDDIQASAKGYEYLAQGILWARERERP